MFSELQKALQTRYNGLITTNHVLFYADIDRDEIFAQYLAGFSDEESRQDSTCNCCKSFLRQYGGILYVEAGSLIVRSIWHDMQLIPARYKGSTDKLAAYCESLGIDTVFTPEATQLGTPSNWSDKHQCTFNHLNLAIPAAQVVRNPDTVRGLARDNHSVFLRGLNEFSLANTDLILELIGQNSLYRGAEFKGALEAYRTLQYEFSKLTPTAVIGWSWIKSRTISEAVLKIRNTAMGTLLIDLNEGMDLENAVSRWERVMAPTNYKRPTALVTPRMFEEAKETVANLGLNSALYRRHAVETDLNINDILYSQTAVEMRGADVFSDLAAEALVNPRTLKSVTEIGIEDFLKNVVPTARAIAVLPQKNHFGNLMSIVAPVEAEVNPLFKWSNGFSWSYAGNVADSMKERVKAAGGKIDAPIRATIQWNEDGKSIIDLDLHAHEPQGGHIYYSQHCGGQRYETRLGGNLDVDMRSPRGVGVENIVWRDVAMMRDGVYNIRVHNFSGHTNFDGFRAEIEVLGEIYEFSFNQSYTGYIELATITKNGNEFTVESKLGQGSHKVHSEEKWGMKTNTWTPVKNIMLSPNHWNGQTAGNKHYMFLLEGCAADETVRPFFNEFLRPELDAHRKSFEIVGNRLVIEPSAAQLSGLGFSETQKNSLLVKVTGQFERVLKVNF